VLFVEHVLAYNTHAPSFSLGRRSPSEAQNES
jgi:hypothetical protein